MRDRVVMRWMLLVPAAVALMALAGLGCFATDPAVIGESEPAAPHEATTSIVRKVSGDRVSEPQVAPPVAEEIQQLLNRLRSAREFLQATKGYSATFTQQVFKDGRLLDPERLHLKLQHEPFAVFIEWERDGQQLLYVEGKYDNKLLVHPTRGIGALRRVWTLEPDHRLVMRSALRPVTEIGMLNTVNLLLGFHKEHILQSHCKLASFLDGDHPCTRVVLTFDSPRQNPYFAKTNLTLCDQRDIPLRIENYSWTKEDGVGPLVESYAYSDVCLEGCVSEADFDRNNRAYSF